MRTRALEHGVSKKYTIRMNVKIRRCMDQGGCSARLRRKKIHRWTGEGRGAHCPHVHFQNSRRPLPHLHPVRALPPFDNSIRHHIYPTPTPVKDPPPSISLWSAALTMHAPCVPALIAYKCFPYSASQRLALSPVRVHLPTTPTPIGLTHFRRFRRRRYPPMLIYAVLPSAVLLDLCTTPFSPPPVPHCFVPARAPEITSSHSTAHTPLQLSKSVINDVCRRIC